MDGLYLYCVRRTNPASIKAVKTIGGGEVCAYSFEELEAVVSEVDLEKFNSEEIQKKAQEDLKWIKEKAQVHEHVIERAMEVGGQIIPVIPMRFGTIFKTKESLEEMISKHQAKFKASLEKLEGKQEWGVKVYLNEEVFTKHLQGGRMDSLEVKTGADFFAKKKMEKIIKEARGEKLQEIIGEIFTNLRNFSVEANQGKNLDKAITGREEPMVLNANFLVKEERVGEFQKEVGELKTKYGDLGLIIQESGPWPPCNFVEIGSG